MIIIMVLIWLLFFAIFFVAGIVAPSYVLGVIAGLLLLIFGLAIIITGIQVESGTSSTFEAGEWIVETEHTDMTLPFSTYAYVFGLIFILTSVFIIYSNAENL